MTEMPHLIGGALGLDFVNTVDPRHAPGRREYLDSYPALVAWGSHAGAIDASQAGPAARGRGGAACRGRPGAGPRDQVAGGSLSPVQPAGRQTATRT